jgi:hypothetical protein
MKLRSVVRDCLFLNWALPVEALPEPPAPLRYQRLSWQGRDYAFASALLFHHDAVRWSALPMLRLGYPQLNVRLYVLDEDGVPSVLFHRELMPAWVAPGMRLVAGHPAASARLDFPRPSLDAGAGSWSWRVERGDTLTVHARVHSPLVGEGPRIGSWEETVRFFQERPRGYAVHGGTLRRVDVWHPPVEAVWPLQAEVTGGDALLRRLLPLSPSLEGAQGAQEVELAWPQDGRHASRAAEGRAAAAGADPEEAGGNPATPAKPATPAISAPTVVLAPPSQAPVVPPFAWPGLHSSWLCPEMPFSIVFDLVPKVNPVVQHLPHPAAGRISSPALRAGSAPDPPDAAASSVPPAQPSGSRVLASAA